MRELLAQITSIFFIVIMFAVSWFIFWGSIMGVQALWIKIKKSQDNERKKHDEIIVKQADELTKLQDESKRLAEIITKRAEQIVRFDEKKDALENEIKELEEKHDQLLPVVQEPETDDQENEPEDDSSEDEDHEEIQRADVKKTVKKTQSKSNKK